MRASGRSLQAVLGVVLLAVGFLVTWQLRAEYAIRQRLRIPSQRLEELGFLLQEQARHRERLESEIAQLRKQLERYADAASRERAVLAAMRQRLVELQALSGVRAVRGPGVVVEVRDSARALQPGDDPNLTLIHYTDLHAIMATLWAAGAEAMALNGERVAPTTGLSCVGTTILCNTKRIAPPYVIAAIGDPDRLLSALRAPDSPLGLLLAFEFPVTVRRVNQLELPAYRGSFQFRFAKPEAEGGR
ncbi:MAG: DUF881 domain-containing protein [Armatimonadota bacterium]|nr:DUF881 domain-containing protein [Armatimonadota bacterium]MDR7443458.1 DUF881 domain-containing protein [Armatimonadota bacterium]MDR7569296.1 DUF881 domain-containing protein [Armatimonadota bacterium]MDR7614956.1 DUF881 domain-containing protein [Armatimonadota bacterium]